MSQFDPNAAASSDSGIFGLPYSSEEASLVLIPVPWEPTVSYGRGTAKGPELILEASRQVDLFDLDLGRFYEAGISMLEPDAEIANWNQEALPLADEVIQNLDRADSPRMKQNREQVNSLSSKLNQRVYDLVRDVHQKNKIAAVIGGDHSVPLGAFKAAAERFGSFGILHFDAHFDLRNAYEGFQYSHASIMRNAIESVSEVTKLVQVGIRDFCEEENQFALDHKDRIIPWFDRRLHDRALEGIPFSRTATEIVADLPAKVWISFDIDGLDPRFCPNTGTPVPGGLDYYEAMRLFSEVVASGREIIGFDLVEVSAGRNSESEWDGNVGARLLYSLCGWTLKSQNKLS